MIISDLTQREQDAIDFAFIRYTWPGANSNEGLVINTQYYVEQFAKEMDKAEYEKSYEDFKTLPPEKQAEIKADIEASKPPPTPPGEEVPPK